MGDDDDDLDLDDDDEGDDDLDDGDDDDLFADDDSDPDEDSEDDDSTADADDAQPGEGTPAQEDDMPTKLTADQELAKRYFPNTPELHGPQKQPTMEQIREDPRVAFPATTFGPGVTERREAMQRADRQGARAAGRALEDAYPNAGVPTKEQDEEADRLFAEKWGTDSGGAA